MRYRIPLALILLLGLRPARATIGAPIGRPPCATIIGGTPRTSCEID